MTVAAALTPLLIVVGCTNDPAPDPVVLPSLTTSPGSAAGSEMEPTAQSPSGSGADPTDSATAPSTPPTHATSRTPTSATSASVTETTTPSTSSTTTSPSYTTTVFVPPSVDDIHPSDHSPPPRDLPAAARKHDETGAAAFAAWYFRWSVYGYQAESSAPLVEYAVECDACQQAIDQIDESSRNDRRFDGDLPAAEPIRVDKRTDGQSEIVLKYASSGYTIANEDGSTYRHFAGGEGFYLITIEWHKGHWSTRRMQGMS